jgi:hypothetical protein
MKNDIIHTLCEYNIDFFNTSGYFLSSIFPLLNIEVIFARSVYSPQSSQTWQCYNTVVDILNCKRMIFLQNIQLFYSVITENNSVNFVEFFK